MREGDVVSVSALTKSPYFMRKKARLVERWALLGKTMTANVLSQRSPPMNSTRHSTLSRPRDDELVEEIAGIVRGETSYSSRNEKTSISMARVLIDITLKAVVDGELELPDEAGQFFKRRGWEKGLHNWVADMTAAGAARFIALRKQGEKDANKG